MPDDGVSSLFANDDRKPTAGRIVWFGVENNESAGVASFVGEDRLDIARVRQSLGASESLIPHIGFFLATWPGFEVENRRLFLAR